MFVIIEGFDKTGKTSIIKHMGKYTNWAEVYLDRGPAGYIFYDEILGRTSDYRYASYIRDSEELQHLTHVVVFLKSRPEDILHRHELHHEKCIIVNPAELKAAQDKYLKIVFGVYKCPILVIDTSLFNIDECCRRIVALKKELMRC